MGNFRNDDRGFSRDRRGSRNSFSGRGDSRGRGGFSRGGRGRDSFERKPLVDVVCDKCGKNCQVPFKPTGDKPVFCSECYEKQGNGRSSRAREPRFSGAGASSNALGISKEQFNEINAKLDKILGILEMIEFEDDESNDEESEEKTKK